MSRLSLLSIVLAIIAPGRIIANPIEAFRVNIDEGSDGEFDSQIIFFYDHTHFPVFVKQVKGHCRRGIIVQRNLNSAIIIERQCPACFSVNGRQVIVEHFFQNGLPNRIRVFVHLEAGEQGPPSEYQFTDFFYNKSRLLKKSVTMQPGPEEKIVTESNYRYHLNEQGQVEQVTIIGSGTPVKNVHHFYYDAGDQLVKETRDYLPSSVPTTTTHYKRDNQGRLVLIKESLGAKELSRTSFSYDSIGRLSRVRGNLRSFYNGRYCRREPWHPLYSIYCLNLNSNPGTAYFDYEFSGLNSLNQQAIQQMLEKPCDVR